MTTPIFDQRPFSYDSVDGFTVSGWFLFALNPMTGKVFQFDITDSLPTPQKMEEFREEAAYLWEAAGNADNENEDDSESTTTPAQRGNEPKGPK